VAHARCRTASRRDDGGAACARIEVLVVLRLPFRQALQHVPDAIQPVRRGAVRFRAFHSLTITQELRYTSDLQMTLVYPAAPGGSSRAAPPPGKASISAGPGRGESGRGKSCPVFTGNPVRSVDLHSVRCHTYLEV
jgi:hypothetical protein